MAGNSPRKESSPALWAGAFLALILAAWGAVQMSGPGAGSGTALLLDALGPSDHATSAEASGKAILLEYGDYQCPACAGYHLLVERLKREMGDKVVFAYRHFPLRQIHPQADFAARIAEAAGVQGKYWEMHDALYRNQRAWADSPRAQNAIRELARGIGLDMDRLESDLKSDRVRLKVEADLQSGLAAGLQGTPTFFLNGSQMPNPRSYEEFRSAVEAAVTDP